MICVTMSNTHQSHRLTDGFWPVVLLAQPPELKAITLMLGQIYEDVLLL